MLRKIGRPSVQDIFRRIFLSNCWWQKSDIWSQASYRYTILWVAFLDPSDSYFLFADRFLPSIVAEKNATKNVHIYSMCIKINKVGKQEVGIRWVQKRFPRYGVQIPTSCLPKSGGIIGGALAHSSSCCTSHNVLGFVGTFPAPCLVTQRISNIIWQQPYMFNV
jgi:hypothetical protein